MNLMYIFHFYFSTYDLILATLMNYKCDDSVAQFYLKLLWTVRIVLVSSTRSFGVGVLSVKINAIIIKVTKIVPSIAQLRKQKIYSIRTSHHDHDYWRFIFDHFCFDTFPPFLPFFKLRIYFKLDIFFFCLSLIRIYCVGIVITVFRYTGRFIFRSLILIMGLRRGVRSRGIIISSLKRKHIRKRNETR